MKWLRVRNSWCLVALLLVVLPAIAAPTTTASAPFAARQIAPLQIGFPERFLVSPDNRWLAIMSLPGEKGSDCSLFERSTHRLTTLQGASRLEPVVFLRDGRHLVVWGYNPHQALRGMKRKPPTEFFLALYDLKRHRFTRYITDAKHEIGVVTAGALSRDGRVLTVVNNNGWLSAFDILSGRLKFRRRALDEGNAPVNLSLSDDRRRLLFAEDWTVDDAPYQRTTVVSARSGRVLRELWLRYPKPNAMMSAATGGEFSPDNRLGATFFAATQEWFFFDTRTGRRLWKMGGRSRTSEGDLKWRFSPDGRRVGVSGPRGFEVRAARTGQVLHRAAEPRDASLLAWSNDGKLIYTINKGDAFEGDAVLWQWRIEGSAREKAEDRLVMARLLREKQRFALSPRHINESLIAAARQGDAARVAFLLAHGANLEARDRGGETPLNIAAFAMDVYGGPKKFAAVVRLLLARGAKVNARSKQKDTPLTSASMGNFEISKILVEHGADVNAAVFDGRTPLHGATNFFQVETVRLLLAHGAKVDARESDGTTPLMEAAGSVEDYENIGKGRGGDAITIIKLLIAHGADVNARDSRWRTALVRAHHPAVARVLREAGAE